MIHAGQLALDLPVGADSTVARSAPVVSGLRLSGTRASVLWQVLQGAYERIGFEKAVSDEVFAQLVLARMIEQVSKADTPRVLARLGIEAVPSYAPIKCRLRQCVEDDWRHALCHAGYAYATAEAGGAVSVVLHDVTTLLCRRRHSNVVKSFISHYPHRVKVKNYSWRRIDVKRASAEKIGIDRAQSLCWCGEGNHCSGGTTGYFSSAPDW